MKKLYLLICCILAMTRLMAQTTETFETETVGFPYFTDNGQQFIITSQGPAIFDVYHFSGGGWNGSAADSRFIDNSGSAYFNTPVQFTIFTNGGVPFFLKSMYLFLAQSNISLNVTGTVTLTGKLAGATVFTASAGQPFNTSIGVNNGFTLFNMATYGGQNNASAKIDEIVITTTGNIAYVALDGFTWQNACSPITSSPSQTNVSCFGGSNGIATVVPGGGTAPYTYSWSPSGGTSATATGLVAGNYTVTITDANGCTGTRNFTITQPAAFSVSTAKTDISCFGVSNGAAAVSVLGGTAPYTYSWSPSGGSGSVAAGLAAGNYTVTITDANSCQTTRNFTINQPSTPVSGTTVVTNVSCNGGNTGAINLTPSGGTGPYTYNWGGGITTEDRTGLTAGTYSVTITDANGCTGTVNNIVVTQPASVLNATPLAQTNIACNGASTGSATVAVTGGTPMYTYSWAPLGGTAATATGLAAGTYTVTVTDGNGCTDTQSFTITQPGSPLSGTTVVTQIACNGGSNGTIDLTPTGGTPGYTYSWSDGPFTQDRVNLAPGTYSVTITDANACSYTMNNIVIAQPSSQVSGTTVVTNVSCNSGSNGAINLTPSGGMGPYTYNWGGGVTTEDRTGLTPGTYSVTITDANGCTGTVNNIIVTQPASVLNATPLAQTNIACNGASTGSATVAVTGGTPGYTYSWSPSGGTAATATGLAAGTYTVTVTDANGCTDTQSFTITQPPAITVVKTQTDVSCSGSNGTATVTVTGGTPGYTYSWSPSGGTAATATGLAAGNYTVTITDANACQVTENFTITNSVPTTTIYSQDFEGTYPWGMTTSALNGTSHVWQERTSGNPTGGTGKFASADSDFTCGAPWDTQLVTPVLDFSGQNNIILTFNSYFQDFLGAGEAWVDVSTDGGAAWTTKFYETNDMSAGLITVDLGDYDGMSNVLLRWRYSDNGDGCAWYWYIDNISIKSSASPLNATAAAQTNVSCSGGSNGSATVAVTGGSGTYSYSWAPSGGTAATATGLAAGTYTVTVTDANLCQTTQSFTITESPSSVSGTTLVTNVSCNGGSNGAINLTPVGGTGPYTYVWNGGATTEDRTGLAAGTYSVTITDANGCTATVNDIIITQPAALNATAGAQTNVSCNGGANGTATVAVTGGTGAYTYSWAPSGGTAATATGLAAGTYTVTVTDANTCQTTQSFAITQPPALTVTPSQTNIACIGGSNGTATVAVTGGSGTYSYSWAPSGGTAATATGLAAGTYTVTITDGNSCQATQSFTITTATPTATIYSQDFEGTYPWGMTTSALNGTSNVWQERTSGNPTGGSGKFASADSDFSCNLAWDTQLVTPVLDFSGYDNVVLTFNSYFQDFIGAGEAWVDVSTNGGAAWTTKFYETNDMPVGLITVDLSDYDGMSNVLVRWRYSDNGDGCAWYWHIDNILIKTNGVDPLVATAGAQTNVSCNGGSNGSATVAVTGGTGAYTYSWAPSGGTAATATGLAAGTYTVTVTDTSGCIDTQSFTITQPAALVATAGAQTNVSCNGGTNGSATVAVTGGTGAYTYSWAPSGGTAATASGLMAGTYTVTVTDANLCQTTQSFTITESPSSVSGTTVVSNVSCNGGNNGAINLTPAGGVGPYTYAWNGGATTEDRTGLTAGTYSVTITDANGCTATVNNIVVTQPAALVATAQGQTNVSCNGGSNGSATVAVTGGTGAYTYSWAPSGGTAATATGLAAGTYTVTVTDTNGCIDTQSFTITQPAALVATAGAQTNVSCNGGTNGSATVAVTGGTGAYTYSWAPSGGTAATASGLMAGTYTVTVTDANLCQTTQSFTITESPSSVSGTTVVTNVSCNGGNNGAINLTPAGGVGPYTYAWNGGTTTEDRTGLTAGTYSVTITDANGCTATLNDIVVTQPAALVATAQGQTNVSCNGGSNGSATVAVTGGTGAYTYSWAPSGGTAATATGLAAGTYTVTVTDANGCFDTQSFTITQPTVVNATAGAQTNVSCNGGANGSATVTVTGGTGAYTYSWAPSGGTAATATGLAAGTYTVTVTDANGCFDTQSFTITQPTVVNATAGAQTNVSCNGGANGSATVAVTGGTGAYTYSWAPSGGTAATATGLAAGTYTVTVTDANGCFDTQSFVITQPTVVNATAGAQTNVSCNGGANGSATVAVTGGTGAYTYAWAPSGGTAATATGLAAGTYTVTVTDANGCTDTQSFTITQPTVVNATAGAQTNVSCNGGTNGSATVTVTGGTGAYTYAWAPSGGTAATATGLAAGTYTVTVTDANGCFDTQNFTITQPTVVNATAGTQTNVSCNGGANGSATVNATGGTGAYTYAWAPSGGTAATAIGLAAGTYTVTVTDANGCTDTQSFTITQPAALTAALTTTNVSCPGAADGTASAAVTGGTGAYTYSWAPSGGTAATATGLAAGTYTVTVTDANGCTVTQSVTVTTTPDVTAPVPDVANLPVITNYCGVLSAEIATPTATDNCNGTITGTTSDPLDYTAVGTYVITWSYDDGNGNTSTQAQTIIVEASPLDQVTFDDATFVYNTGVQAIEVNNLPAGAQVTYTTTPATGSDNGAVNAGVYTVTATLTPPAEAFNCEAVTLTATLTIDRAPQTITFDPLAVRNLESDPDFQLGATASSGLPVSYTYSYTSPQAPAMVTPEGFVDMLTSGEVLITAHQEGNENYLPAESVDQLLIIESSDATIGLIIIGDESHENPAGEIYYLIDCDDTSESVEVSIVAEVGATVTPGLQFSIATPVPGIYTQEVTVISQDGTNSAVYTITVEKRFDFFAIVEQKFDNVLLVNNNPATNGGYKFTAYQWFRNGQPIGTGQYYSAGDNMHDRLDPTAEYYVKMTTVEGDVLQTCVAQITFEHAYASRLYPNPSAAGRFITVEADFPQAELDNMHIRVYSLTGSLVSSVEGAGAVTRVKLPDTLQDGTYIVVLETPNQRKSLKVIVRN